MVFDVATYKYPNIIGPETGEVEFDRLHTPGEAVPLSGIYRCEGCAFEDVGERGRIFPPARDPHVCRPGATKWRLIVKAIHVSR
jgi:hypothetical protein